MLKSIRRLFSSPVVPDPEDKTRRASLLNVILNAQTSVRLKSVAGHEVHTTSMKESAK